MLKMNADTEFTELLKHLCKIQGIDDLTATILAKLFIEPEEISMEDLAKKTGYSLASISNKIKLFEQIDIIKKKTKPGTRKIFLYMEKDFSKFFIRLFLKKLEVVSIAKTKLPGIIKNYEAQAKSNKEKQKLQLIENYYNSILKFDKILQELLQKIKDLE